MAGSNSKINRVILLLYSIMRNIKNIILDLGGVLLNIDYNKTTEAFRGLGVVHFEEMFSQLTANDIFAKLETGRISDDLFYEEMQKAIPHPVSRVEIDEAWNAMLLSFRTETLALLEQWRSRYRLFLLSNTNSIHLKAFREMFTRDTGKPTLDVYFEKTWYSHLIGYRKPDAETYRYVLGDAGLQAGETIFVDDTEPNITGAAVAGIKTHLLLPTETIADLDL